MFYVVKFFESLVFVPGIFVVLLLIVGISKFHQHRFIATMAILVALLLYATSTSVVANSLIRPLESYYSPPKNPEGDVLIMLGGGATEGTPSPAGAGNLTGDGANRLLTTAMLYHETGLPILLSGGPVRGNTSESLIAKQELISLGVPADNITAENKSLDTLQNAEYAKPILKQNGYLHPILITSAYHMRRAVLDFKKTGIDVTPYPCGYYADTIDEFRYDSLFPSTASLMVTQTALHEYVGIAAAEIGLKG